MIERGTRWCRSRDEACSALRGQVVGMKLLRSFGDDFKQARETRGIRLEAVADATRIAPRHLKALERGDIAALPAAPFTKGYIRAYAQFLGIDPQPMLDAYRSEERDRGLGTPEAESRMLEQLSRLVEHQAPRAGSRRGFRAGMGVALALLAVGLLGVSVWLWKRAEAPHAAVATPLPARDATPVQERGEPGSAREAAALPTSPPLPSPIPARATPPAPAASRTAAAIHVSDYGVGSGIRGHRLVGSAESFVEGDSVVFWTLVVGGTPGDVIRHLWLHEGQVVMRADLTLGGWHWRTYSRRLLGEGSTGQWTVEALAPDGSVLARQEFLCVPRRASPVPTDERSGSPEDGGPGASPA
jgi:transcriptional regulator with XRE-family HTH domain